MLTMTKRKTKTQIKQEIIEQIKQGVMPNPERERKILGLKDKNGYTIAHYMAEYGYVFDPDRYGDILRLRDRNGFTVAHIMAVNYPHL